MQIIKKTMMATLLTAGVALSSSAFALSQSCQLVAKMAGPEYASKADRLASMLAPEDLPKSLDLTVVERHGAWFIYQATSDWFDRDECAPKIERIGSTDYEFVPVVLNKHTGTNAVVNGIFLIKTYREKHISELEARYGFIKVTQLPNRFTAVFDVKPQVSYDKLIEVLDRDRDIEFAAPLLSEPRYKPR